MRGVKPDAPDRRSRLGVFQAAKDIAKPGIVGRTEFALVPPTSDRLERAVGGEHCDAAGRHQDCLFANAQQVQGRCGDRERTPGFECEVGGGRLGYRARNEQGGKRRHGAAKACAVSAKRVAGA